MNNYPNALVVIVLTMVIVLVKFILIKNELKYSKHKLSYNMFKSNVIEGIILFLQILASYITPFPKTKWDGVIISIGLCIFIFGLFLSVWGLRSIGMAWGLPGKQSHGAGHNILVTTGAFGFSRNPIYVGITCIYLGFGIAIRSWLILLRIPLMIYFYRSSILEEQLLEKKFGAKYLKYKKKIPRFLFI